MKIIIQKRRTGYQYADSNLYNNYSPDIGGYGLGSLNGYNSGYNGQFARFLPGNGNGLNENIGNLQMGRRHLQNQLGFNDGYKHYNDYSDYKQSLNDYSDYNDYTGDYSDMGSNNVQAGLNVRRGFSRYLLQIQSKSDYAKSPLSLRHVKLSM